MFQFCYRTRWNVDIISITFFTRSLPFLTELYHLFYVDGIKVIPAVEIMYHLLTPEALAHWIIGDGGAVRSGLILYTNSFSVIDNIKLINILMVRYQLDCTLISRNRISIKAASMPRLRAIVLPYIHYSILYKLGL